MEMLSVPSIINMLRSADIGGHIAMMKIDLNVFFKITEIESAINRLKINIPRMDIFVIQCLRRPEIWLQYMAFEREYMVLERYTDVNVHIIRKTWYLLKPSPLEQLERGRQPQGEITADGVSLILKNKFKESQ